MGKVLTDKDRTLLMSHLNNTGVFVTLGQKTPNIMVAHWGMFGKMWGARRLCPAYPQQQIFLPNNHSNKELCIERTRARHARRNIAVRRHFGIQLQQVSGAWLAPKTRQVDRGVRTGRMRTYC